MAWPLEVRYGSRNSDNSGMLTKAQHERRYRSVPGLLRAIREEAGLKNARHRPGCSSGRSPGCITVRRAAGGWMWRSFAIGVRCAGWRRRTSFGGFRVRLFTEADFA
jgi:hypothetical protein